MIEVKNLYISLMKDYYELYDVSLKINQGESLAIVGDDTSGNSFLLRAIAGLEEFNRGNIFFNSKPMRKVSFKKDVRIAFLSSKGLFFENKSVRKNLNYVLRAWRIKNRGLVDKALEKYGLLNLSDTKIKFLSNMERVLVQLARISLVERDIILIDKIFKGFAGDERLRIIDLMDDFYAQNESKTIVLATEDKKIPKLPIDRTIFINFGIIEND